MLQVAMTHIQNWTKKCRINLNESMSVLIDFYKQINYKIVNINNKQVPQSNTAKYFGMILDVKLR